MDDERERHGCRYYVDWLFSRDVDGLPLEMAGLILLFLAIVVGVRSGFSDYYIFDTWLDKYAFGCFGLFIVMAVLGGLSALRHPSSALLRVILTLLFQLALLALIGFIAIAIFFGLRD